MTDNLADNKKNFLLKIQMSVGAAPFVVKILR